MADIDQEGLEETKAEEMPATVSTPQEFDLWCTQLESQLIADKVESVLAWSTRETSRLATAADRMDFADRLRLQGSAWTTVLQKLYLAYSHTLGTRRSVKLLMSLVAECYIPMMPTFSPRCSLVDEYRQALRYVLDDWYTLMMSGMMARPAQMQKYLESRPSFSSLSKKQRAAVLAIKAMFFLTEKSEILRQAVSLNRAEGQWRLYLGEELREQRDRSSPQRTAPSDRELELLRAAARLRPGPETMRSLAQSLLFAGEEGVQEAKKILEDALERWPDNVYVVWGYFTSFPMIHKPLPMSEKAERVQRLLQRLLALTGDCGAVHCKMMTLAFIYELGPAVIEKHFRAALRLNPAACLTQAEQLMSIIPADARRSDRDVQAWWRQLKRFVSQATPVVNALRHASEARSVDV